MSKYIVTRTYQYDLSVEVDATSEKEALALAEGAFAAMTPTEHEAASWAFGAIAEERLTTVEHAD